VLVVVAARNEELRLGATLQGLLAEPSRLLHVVVVDDRSEDGTAAVVGSFVDDRLSLLRLQDDPPPGVFGKPRALATALKKHHDAALVAVIDADVTVGAGFLGGLVLAHRTAGVSATSALPTLHNQSFVEELLVPAFVAAVAVTHPPSRVMSGEKAFLNGQLLLVDRAALDDVGGFEAVSHTVLEDVEIARLLLKKHHRLQLVDARGLAHTRMYDGLAAIVAGFGKNARALHGGALVPLALVLVFTAWAPWVALGLSLTTDVVVDDVVAAGGFVASLGLTVQNRRRLHSWWWLAVLSPLAQAVVAAVYLAASLRRRASWRGRSFST
jgi:cellulose synthase/poly-beta-1,6-N-acetylglucosamine synthase-like glycosyltransferase